MGLVRGEESKKMHRYTPAQGLARQAASGFTLIELLVVVAIIAILAAIATPNFLEAQTRAKIARVHNDLRAIATGLEQYAVDHNCYPPVPIALGPRFRRFQPLTTPIAYLTDIPQDPFQSNDPHGHGRWKTGVYGYGAMSLDKPSRWILCSDGPDRVLNMSHLQLMFYPGYSPDLFTLYDASNGTVSRGDIMRMNDYQISN
jgi:general secretion pathway protein G